MPVPSPPIVDDFNRPDETLSGTWLSPIYTGIDTAPAIVSNRVRAPGDNAVRGAYWAGLEGQDWELAIRLPEGTDPIGNRIALRARIINAGTDHPSWYDCDVDTTLTEMAIGFCLNGATGTLVTLPGGDLPDPGSWLSLIIRGTEISMWANDGTGWENLLNASDTRVRGRGHAGFAATGFSAVGAAYVDDFSLRLLDPLTSLESRSVSPQFR